MGRFYESLLIDKEEMKPYFCLLSHVENIGNATYQRLQERFDSPKDLFVQKEQVIKDTNILSMGQFEALMRVRSMYGKDARGYYDALAKRKIGFVSLEEEDYPQRLKDIPDRPIGLFYMGKLPDDMKPSAGVIGARECSFYGEEAAGLIGESLGENGIAVISGMARGIDSLAQIAAVDAGGESFAILGGGADICYPKESIKLYERLKSEGGIISEYPPGTRPEKTHFIRRNRLISGLSNVLCVVEAKKKSGTLITVDCALEQGRDVFAVPGRITDRTAAGCNELIRQGAEILSDPKLLAEDILMRYGVYETKGKECRKNEVRAEQKLSYMEETILRLITEDSFVPEDLLSFEAMQSYGNAYEILTACMVLSYAGFLVNMGGGRFRISKKGASYRNMFLQVP